VLFTGLHAPGWNGPTSKPDAWQNHD
jgi:hypothetical protein